MDGIQAAGGIVPRDDLSGKAGAAGDPGNQVVTADSFAKAAPSGPSIAKEKILQDMILNQNKEPLHMLWCADLQSPVVATPMSSPDGNTIYTACVDGNLHAVDTVTGAEKWKAPSGAGYLWEANVTLSHDGNYVFVTGRNGVLECIDASRGEKKWSISSPGGRTKFSQSAYVCGEKNECTTDGSTIFVSLENWKLSAIDVKTGEKKWDTKLQYETYGKPVLSSDEKKLYLGVGQGATGFDIIDAATGKKKGHFHGGDPALCAAAIDSSGKKVFVAGLRSFSAHRLNKKGDQIWKFGEGFSGIFALPPVLNEKDSMVYALHYDIHEGSTIYGLDSGTGQQKWTYEAHSEIPASPTLSRDGSTLYIGTKDGEFAAVDTATGKKKWGFKTTTTSSPGVSPDGKVIYIGGSDGRVYALSEDALYLARKVAQGEGSEEEVPSIVLGDGYVEIGGLKLGINPR